MIQDDERTVGFYEYDMSTDPVVGWVVVLNGKIKGKSFELRTGNNFIGRNPSINVVLEGDIDVSDRHAVIIYDPVENRFFVGPLTHNVVVIMDGQTVSEHVELTSKKIITVGNTRLMFVAFCNDKFDWKGRL